MWRHRHGILRAGIHRDQAGKGEDGDHRHDEVLGGAGGSDCPERLPSWIASKPDCVPMQFWESCCPVRASVAVMPMNRWWRTAWCGKVSSSTRPDMAPASAPPVLRTFGRSRVEGWSKVISDHILVLHSLSEKIENSAMGYAYSDNAVLFFGIIKHKHNLPTIQDDVICPEISKITLDSASGFAPASRFSPRRSPPSSNR